MTRFAHRAWPFGVLLFLLLAAFGPTVATGHLLVTGDSVAVYFPHRVLVAEALRHFTLPLWNPYSFGGTPLFAMVQGGVFYPGNAAFLVLPPVLAMNLTVVALYAVAGVGAFLLARASALGRLPATLAGVVYMGSGCLVAHLEHLTFSQAASLLPWVLWAIARHRQTLASGWALAFAGVLLLQLLAGYPQVVVQTALLAVPFALWLGRDLRGPALGGYLARLALAAGLAGGAALAQMLPLFDLLAASGRSRLSFAELTTHALNLRHYLTLLFPFLFGGHPTSLFPVPYWGIGPFFADLTGYVGLGTLMLAVAAAGRWKADPGVRFWVLAAAGAFVLTFGSATPVYALWHWIPGLNMVRVPGRHVVELDLCLAMLAAFGLAGLTRRGAAVGLIAVGVPMAALTLAIGSFGGWYAARQQPFMPPGFDLAGALTLSQPAVWVPLCFFVLTGAALVGAAWRPGRLSFAALVGAIALDLWLFGQHEGFRQLAPVPGPLPAVVESESRVLSVAAGAYPFRDFDRVAALRMPNWNILSHERHIGGSEAFVSDRYSRLVGGMTNYGFVADRAVFGDGHHALDLLGCGVVRVEAGVGLRLGSARWVVRPGSAPPSALTGTFPPARGEGTRGLQEKTGAMPPGGGGGGRRFLPQHPRPAPRLARHASHDPARGRGRRRRSRRSALRSPH